MTPQYVFRDRWPRPLWLLYRVMKTVLVASAFFFFWGGAVILAWTLLPLVAVFARDSRKACQKIVVAAFRLFHEYMRVLRLVDRRILNPEDAPRTPVVYVANHATLVDVTAVFSTIPNVCAVAGARFHRSPFVGRLLRLCGFIPDGVDVESRARLLDEAKKRLDDGYSILLFPEGARSPLGEMRRFHRGAFEVACRAKVPVVPLVIRCDPSALRKDMRIWHQPDTVAHLTIELDPAIDPAEYEFGSRRMRDAVEARFRSRLGLPQRRIESAIPSREADDPSFA